MQEAIEIFKKLIQSDPSLSEAHYNLGLAYTLEKDYQQAVKEFEQALANEDVQFKPFIHFNIGAVYYKIGYDNKDVACLTKAKERLAKVIAALPMMVLPRDMYNFAASPFFGEKSNALILDAIGIPPDTAIFCKTMGRGEREMYVFDKEAPPPMFFYHSPSCYYYLALGSESGTKETLKNDLLMALSLISKEPRSKFNDAFNFSCLLELSQYGAEDIDEAVKYVQKAIDLNLGYPKAYAFLGTGYYKKKEYEKAREVAIKALQLDPNYERAKILLKMLDEIKAPIENGVNYNSK